MPQPRFGKGFPTGSVDFTNGNLNIATPVLPQSCTVFCFANRTVNAGDCTLICIGGDSLGTANSFLGITSAFGALQFFWNGTNFIAAPGVNSLKTWYAYAFTGNGIVGSAYTVDKTGNLSSTSGSSGGGIVAGSPQQLNISNDDEGDGNWQGLIAGVLVYNFPMTSKDIRAQARQLAPITERGLISNMRIRNIGNAGFDSALPGRVWTTSGTLVRSTSSPPIPELFKQPWNWFDS